MKGYNGFSPEYRNFIWRKQKESRAKGIIPDWEKLDCEICGANGNCMPHLEDYTDYNNYHPLCIECHMRLHARFKNPTAWLRHLDRCSRGYKCRVWKSVSEYFNNSNWEIYPEYKGLKGSDFGDKWYHKLELREIDLGKMPQKKKVTLLDY